MYYILNPDGSRYGPADTNTIAQWNREGRIAQDAQFLDAATEEQVDRERVLLPMPPAMPTLGQSFPQVPPPTPPTYPQQPPSPYGGVGQAQGYQTPNQPRLNDVPPGYAPPGSAPQPYLTGAPGYYGQMGNPNHNPIVAALLCFLCVIAGYGYNKQWLKGIVVTIALFSLGAIIGDTAGSIIGFGGLAFVMFDCYKIGERVKAGETVGDWQFM